MIIEARALYGQRWKKLTQCTEEEWLGKLSDLVELNKLASLIREQTLLTFIGDRKSLTDILCKNEKTKLVIYGFDN